MNRRSFTQIMALAPVFGVVQSLGSPRIDHRIRLLRHATLVVEKGGIRFLVDPMFAPKASLDPVGNAANSERIPMVDLPVTAGELVQIVIEADAILVTHTHRDHWDAVAQGMIDKSKPIFCQPSDTDKIRSQGFTNVTAVEDETVFRGVTIYRTGGSHGTGDIGQKMGAVSGFVLGHGGSKVYIAGDTIWCPAVEKALELHAPRTIVVNAGGAQFLSGDPITMSPRDVKAVCKHQRGATVIAVHMDTINHCLVKRSDLEQYARKNKLRNLFIPEDGHLHDFESVNAD